MFKPCRRRLITTSLITIISRIIIRLMAVIRVYRCRLAGVVIGAAGALSAGTAAAMGGAGMAAGLGGAGFGGGGRRAGVRRARRGLWRRLAWRRVRWCQIRWRRARWLAPLKYFPRLGETEFAEI